MRGYTRRRRHSQPASKRSTASLVHLSPVRSPVRSAAGFWMPATHPRGRQRGARRQPPGRLRVCARSARGPEGRRLRDAQRPEACGTPVRTSRHGAGPLPGGSGARAGPGRRGLSPREAPRLCEQSRRSVATPTRYPGVAPPRRPRDRHARGRPLRTANRHGGGHLHLADRVVAGSSTRALRIPRRCLLGTTRCSGKSLPSSTRCSRALSVGHTRGTRCAARDRYGTRHR